MLSALSDDALATIAEQTPRLRDVVSFSWTCRRHTTLLRRTITVARDRPAAAAQRLGVSHLEEDVKIFRRQIDPADVGELVRLSAVLTNLTLCDNDIGPSDATAIADGLKVNKVLTNLK